MVLAKTSGDSPTRRVIVGAPRRTMSREATQSGLSTVGRWRDHFHR